MSDDNGHDGNHGNGNHGAGGEGGRSAVEGLRVVTYNIHRAIGVDRRFRPERIVEILSHHRPDVVLLQEVDEGAPRSRELDLARELAHALGFDHFAVGHNVSLKKGRYGNATLSRFPIARERNIDLTIGRRKRRGCQHTTLDLGGGSGGRLEVFNLHLGLSAWERWRQLELLARSPELRHLPTDEPVLLGGDFNDWRSRLQPLLASHLGFDLATGENGRGSLRTFPSFSPQGGLDRIYYRGSVDVLEARVCPLPVSRLASDHLPVVADFDVG